MAGRPTVRVVGVLRLATYNVNGIRAAQRRGFAGWKQRCLPDVACLQEVRCPYEALPMEAFAGFHVAYDAGELKGRNGVAVLSRTPFDAVRVWSDQAMFISPAGDARMAGADELSVPDYPLARPLRSFNHEGRYVEVDLADQPLTVACVYVPKGDSLLAPGIRSRDPLTDEQLAGVQRRYDRKMAFLAGFSRHLTRARRAAHAAGREFLVVGDFNIAHTRLDVKNWRPAQKASGFLPEERAWLSEQLSPRTLVDVVRAAHPDQDGPYSWWSWMGQAFARDTGWRIDYHLASPQLARRSARAFVDRDHGADERVSDHAAVVVDYDL